MSFAFRTCRLLRSLYFYIVLSYLLLLLWRGVGWGAVSEDRGITWTSGNLDPELPQRDAWVKNEWREAMVLGHIPQAKRERLQQKECYSCFHLVAC